MTSVNEERSATPIAGPPGSAASAGPTPPAGPTAPASLTVRVSPTAMWVSMGCVVGVALASSALYSIWRGTDFVCYDDLARTVLSKSWAQEPFFFTSDHYWLPLPFIARGCLVKAFAAIGLAGPGPALFAIRLVGFVYLMGAWILLAACLRRWRAGWTPIALFSLFYCANFATLELSASALSEPDFIFWSAFALWGLARWGGRAELAATDLIIPVAGLALACLTRYEAWALSGAAAGVFILWDRRPSKGRWTFLLGLLPLIPMVLWIAASAVRLGDPFHFLSQEQSYAGVFSTSRSLGLTARTLLKINPLLAPLVIFFGAWECARRAREPEGRPLALFAAVFAAWAAYALWNHQATGRFAWGASVFTAVAAALAMERAADRFAPRTRRIGFGALVAASLIYFAVLAPRQVPYLDPELRRFALELRTAPIDGRILLRDHLGPDSVLALAAFRALSDVDRLVPCDWIEACEGSTPEELGRFRLGAVLARARPDDLPTTAPPLLTSSRGWSLWRLTSGE